MRLNRFQLWKMEKELEKCLDELSHIAGVQGVLCADRQGLPVSSRGKVPSSAAGVVSTIARIANQLEPSSPPPKIILESEGLNILIQSRKGITTAIYKSNTKL